MKKNEVNIPKQHWLGNVDEWYRKNLLMTYGSTFIYNTEEYRSSPIITNKFNQLGFFTTLHENDLVTVEKIEYLNKVFNFSDFILLSSGFKSNWILNQLNYDGSQPILFYDQNIASLHFKRFLITYWPGPLFQSIDDFFHKNFNELTVNLLSIIPENYKNLWNEEMRRWNSEEEFQNHWTTLKDNLMNIYFIHLDLTNPLSVNRLVRWKQQTIESKLSFFWTSNIWDRHQLLNTSIYPNKDACDEERIDHELFSIYLNNFWLNLKGQYLIFGNTPNMYYSLTHVDENKYINPWLNKFLLKLEDSTEGWKQDITDIRYLREMLHPSHVDKPRSKEKMRWSIDRFYV